MARKAICFWPLRHQRRALIVLFSAFHCGWFVRLCPQVKSVSSLLYAAYRGDVSSLRRCSHSRWITSNKHPAARWSFRAKWRILYRNKLWTALEKDSFPPSASSSFFRINSLLLFRVLILMWQNIKHCPDCETCTEVQPCRKKLITSLQLHTGLITVSLMKTENIKLRVYSSKMKVKPVSVCRLFWCELLRCPHDEQSEACFLKNIWIFFTYSGIGRGTEDPVLPFNTNRYTGWCDVQCRQSKKYKVS